MAKDLLYQPSLGYKKTYYTEGDLLDIASIEEESSSLDTSNPLEDKIDIITDTMNKIDNMLPVIPESFINVFLPPYLITKDVINKIESDILPNVQINPIPEREEPKWNTQVDNNSTSIESGDVSSDPFGTLPDPVITPNDITVTLDPIKEQENKYIEDLEDIVIDYTKSLCNALESYFQSVLTYHSQSEVTGLSNITTKKLTNKKISHVSDYLTKSSITLNQKMKLYNKMYTIDQSIYHYRAIKISNEQIKRYKGNKKVKNKNTVSKIGNAILKESIMVAEKKYKENFYSLYKYLNSSVILLDECMNVAAKQMSALILLNNEERGK